MEEVVSSNLTRSTKLNLNKTKQFCHERFHAAGEVTGVQVESKFPNSRAKADAGPVDSAHFCDKVRSTAFRMVAVRPCPTGHKRLGSLEDGALIPRSTP